MNEAKLLLHCYAFMAWTGQILHAAEKSEMWAHGTKWTELKYGKSSASRASGARRWGAQNKGSHISPSMLHYWKNCVFIQIQIELSLLNSKMCVYIPGFTLPGTQIFAASFRELCSLWRQISFEIKIINFVQVISTWVLRCLAVSTRYK